MKRPLKNQMSVGTTHLNCIAGTVVGLLTLFPRVAMLLLLLVTTTTTWAGSTPTGNLEVCNGGHGSIHVQGWCEDPERETRRAEPSAVAEAPPSLTDFEFSQVSVHLIALFTFRRYRNLQRAVDVMVALNPDAKVVLAWRRLAADKQRPALRTVCLLE